MSLENNFPKIMKLRKNYYLLSGVGPSAAGAGRLVNKLIPEAVDAGFVAIYPYERQSFRGLIKSFSFLKVIAEILKKYFVILLNEIKIRQIANSKIILIHPQTLGYKKLFDLIENGNQIYLYVMDSGYFCMRSYNTHPVNGDECLNCIDTPKNAHDLCKPFPVSVSKFRETQNILSLKSVSKKIIFLAQNNNQKYLLEKANDGIICKIVGMDTGEFDSLNTAKDYESPYKDSIVFHGSTVTAKGIDYFVGLCDLLTDINFIVPDTIANVESVLGRKLNSKNLIFKPCNWESGLKELVTNCKIVMNPSMWSAPIEGALMKSMLCNVNVATVETIYGYQSEIKDPFVFGLDKSLAVAAKQLAKIIADLDSPDEKKRIQILSERKKLIKRENIFDFVKTDD